MLSSAFGETKLPRSTNRKIDFEKDIQPVLSQKCYSCHGEDAQQSGLRLDKRQNALRGGDYDDRFINSWPARDISRNEKTGNDLCVFAKMLTNRAGHGSSRQVSALNNKIARVLAAFLCRSGR